MSHKRLGRHEEMSRLLPPAPAAPLEDDNLLTEILLRLPPQPSSLPRASLVCKRWRRLVSEPGFVRRFRIHHRRNPPLLGFFSGLSLVPTMEPPNRLPYGGFSWQLDLRGDERYLFHHTLGCRHGLVLVFIPQRRQLLVLDPVTSDQHPIAIPSSFTPLRLHGQIRGAVLRAAGNVQHFQFQAVIVGTVEQQHNELAVAQVYSSDTGIWGNIISTPLPPNSPDTPNCVPGVLVGGSLYWVLGKANIVEFDLGMQRLAVIPLPVAKPMYAESNFECSVMRAAGGGLGCLVLSKFSAQLWKRKPGCDGVSAWVLGRTIELDKLLSLNSEKHRRPLKILGFAENNSVMLLQTIQTGIRRFTIQLQSLQFKEFIDIKYKCCYHPFESVYTAGSVIGGGHDGAELLDKT